MEGKGGGRVVRAAPDSTVQEAATESINDILNIKNRVCAQKNVNHWDKKDIQ